MLLSATHESRTAVWRHLAKLPAAERMAGLELLGSMISHEVLSEIGLYAPEYREALAETVVVLDGANRFLGDGELAEAYAAVADDHRHATIFISLVIEKLRSMSGLARASEMEKQRAAELAGFWRSALDEHHSGEYLSVGEVATRFGKTPQAVYRWIKDGKILAEETPGGGYRVSAAQFNLSNLERRQLVAISRRLRERAGRARDIARAREALDAGPDATLAFATGASEERLRSLGLLAD